MNNNIKKYLKLATNSALKGELERSYLVGAVGVRCDGAVVYARNSIVQFPNRQAHAEYRLSRKLDVGSTVYVARVTKNGLDAIARPCHSCQKVLASSGVKKVYYTIGENEYGTMLL